MQIVCPTHGRAGKVRAYKVFGPDLLLCVSKSQLPLYKDAYPNGNFEVHPDEVIGLSAKRQWIYDRFGDSFQVDDDVHQAVDLTKKAGEASRVTDPKVVNAIIERTFWTAKEIGAYAFSLCQFSDPALFKPMHPFRVTGFITGHSLGLIAGSKLWFPKDRYVVAEDMWISALNAHYHRYCFIDRRYALVPFKTFVSTGAQAEHRTMETLKQNYDRFQAAFGKDVIRQKTDTPRARRAYEWAITLKLPF